MKTWRASHCHWHVVEQPPGCAHDASTMTNTSGYFHNLFKCRPRHQSRLTVTNVLLAQLTRSAKVTRDDRVGNGLVLGNQALAPGSIYLLVEHCRADPLSVAKHHVVHISKERVSCGAYENAVETLEAFAEFG